MDQLKTYAVPIVALVILLVWFFLIRPKLGEGGDASGDSQSQKAETSAKAQTAETTE